MSKHVTKLFLIGLVALMLFSSSVQVDHPSAVSAVMGVVIPLYIYPGPSWQQVVQEKQAYPNVPIIAVINPDSGPGLTQDPFYVEGIQQLQSAGIVVVGYVYTNYGQRSISSVETDASRYKDWYGVTGILFDEMANVNGFEDYYSTLNNYAKSLGFNFTLANPGTAISTSYYGIVDCIVISETSQLPQLYDIERSVDGYPPSNFALVSYDVNTLNQSYLNDVSDYVSFIYATNDNLPNPYDTLPSYFSSLVQGVSSTNVSSSQNNVDATATISVKSVALNGTVFSGMWTTVQLNGSVLAKGYTPFQFTGTVGVQYTVTVANFNSYVFRNWEGGIPNPSDTFKLTHEVVIALNQNVALQAYYYTPTNSSAITTSIFTSHTTSVQSSSVIDSSATNSISYTTQRSTGTGITVSTQATISNYKFPYRLLLPLTSIIAVILIAVSLVMITSRSPRPSQSQ